MAMRRSDQMMGAVDFWRWRKVGCSKPPVFLLALGFQRSQVLHPQKSLEVSIASILGPKWLSIKITSSYGARYGVDDFLVKSEAMWYTVIARRYDWPKMWLAPSILTLHWWEVTCQRKKTVGPEIINFFCRSRSSRESFVIFRWNFRKVPVILDIPGRFQSTQVEFDDLEKMHLDYEAQETGWYFGGFSPWPQVMRLTRMNHTPRLVRSLQFGIILMQLHSNDTRVFRNHWDFEPWKTHRIHICA